MASLTSYLYNLDTKSNKEVNLPFVFLSNKILSTMQQATRFPFPVPHTLKDFIWFYRTIVGQSKLPDTDDRMSLNFEDLIYQYDETVNTHQKKAA